jgi:hypothetical protein
MSHTQESETFIWFVECKSQNNNRSYNEWNIWSDFFDNEEEANDLKKQWDKEFPDVLYRVAKFKRVEP